MIGPTGHELDPLKVLNRGKFLTITTVVTDAFEINLYYVNHIEA